MKTEHFQEELLNRAIHSEIEAAKFYAAAAEGAGERSARRLTRRLSSDEESHRKLLTKRYRKQCGKEFVADSSFPASPKVEAATASFFSDSLSHEVLSIAIGLEKDAIEYYSGLQNQVTDGKDLKLISRLVGFEQGHLSRLQRIYNRKSPSEPW